MRKIILYTAIFLLVSGSLQAQDISLEIQKVPKLSKSEQAALWKQAGKKTVVSFGTSSLRYTTDIPTVLTSTKTWKAESWKNEKIHTQILVSAGKKIKNLSVEVSDLRSDTGQIIPKENIWTGFVQEVMTDEFSGGCGYRKPVDFDSSMVADQINSQIQSVSLQQYSTQAIWLSVKVPENTLPGKYNGTITVKADKKYKLNLNLTVIDQRLPDPKDWKFHLDLWQHPAAIARVHQVPLWSDEHFNLMRNYYEMLANAGQKIITAAIVEEPWNHQTYDDFPSLIKWTKKADGGWEYDYKLFDKYVEFVMSCGITQRINCYSMVPWEIAFPYFDESTGKTGVLKDAIGTASYNEFWGIMLTDFTRHLKQKGWFDITAIAMDERPMEAMKSVITLLKSIDKGWKIALAGDWHPEIENDIYDYCVSSRWNYPEKMLSDRKLEGKVSTWYTCCAEKYPNMFTFSPPDESVWMGWYTAATEMDGFLRWAYNSWPKDPVNDSRFTAWPAGDTYMIYPGPNTSIRFEKIIEGIQDFEKINILKNYYQNQPQKLSQLQNELQKFEIQQLQNFTAHEMIENAKQLLNP